ncbi:outer membrane beta-barrel protein [Helicobacter cynogastricus]|uniref:outer membrane beta-barrel protein n=1 Tax=Helicobacter cynogastricus TaxID=329937 RepID=UPI000CF0D183|nr:outer membrane beta-barrel protein [Helicobacter cynogastricus]
MKRVLLASFLCARLLAESNGLYLSGGGVYSYGNIQTHLSSQEFSTPSVRTSFDFLGYNFSLGFKHFFFCKKRCALRYHIDFSKSNGEPYGLVMGLAGMDFMYNFYESPKMLLNFGLYAGFGLAIQHWLGVEALRFGVRDRIMPKDLPLPGESKSFQSSIGALEFQLPLSVGLRYQTYVFGLELGALFPLIPNHIQRFSQGVSGFLEMKRDFALVFNLVLALDFESFKPRKKPSKD